MYEFYFEKLEVWQNARILNKDVYLLTSKFPKEELFAIVSQLRRATSSIAANTSEGMSRETSKEKKRFLNIAYALAMEVINFLNLSLDFLTEVEYRDIRSKIEHITNQLRALSKKV
ncbi:four helix bundle protein [Myroides marinus]|uniref:four helix bundle protein n=1 Tax=Myroides marinus TaxID=703342 RepID=UPI0025780864|nr:four helix bundle protein [Myroides marinus]MDM1380704.1 four helix bundle protein [Myroides marinus]MDM1387982.1 four helix bundle protein [Myroides marinus]MDM1395188.1 four helix bundle protein [Myroides marinus]